jgi:hypothetical protein
MQSKHQNGLALGFLVTDLSLVPLAMLPKSNLHREPKIPYISIREIHNWPQEHSLGFRLSLH